MSDAFPEPVMGLAEANDLLTAPGGRLYESRKAVINAAARSKYLRLTAPSGALYAFLEVREDALPDFHDQQFALELLEESTG